jgi:hypothetical protein
MVLSVFKLHLEAHFPVRGWRARLWKSCDFEGFVGRPLESSGSKHLSVCNFQGQISVLSSLPDSSLPCEREDTVEVTWFGESVLRTQNHQAAIICSHEAGPGGQILSQSQVWCFPSSLPLGSRPCCFPLREGAPITEPFSARAPSCLNFSVGPCQTFSLFLTTSHDYLSLRLPKL